MKLSLINPKKSLNKAYLKEKVGRAEIEKFKRSLTSMITRINDSESEEHLKNVVSDFLKETWYKDLHEINTKQRNDLVIHTGKTAKEPVGVIIEAKRPANKSEMISEARPNVKAMQELVLYYLRERIEHSNIDIKYLIATNIYQWYIIDEVWFEKNVFRNIKLKKDYENWKLSGKDTKFFYDSIAKPFLDSIEEIVYCTHFDIREYQPYIQNNNRLDDTKLIALYKILSPVHLLKLPFANDSNSLDRQFYSELLYLIGLEEVKDGRKKLIKRKEKPESASLIENTISKLKGLERLENFPDLSSFGNSQEEQLYNIALELCITWINRILFLKLLEAQLFKYHKKDLSFLFLNSQTIHDFDELSDLFFQVLAEKVSKRNIDLKHNFKNIPYLNSSLFERTDIEKQTIDIGNLDNRLQFPLYSTTVLKDNQGKRRVGKLPTLQYLFEFLDAYDFASEGSEEIQEQNKNLISASVLGLIFEKINGYKDGAFFTPGFVTMYMCKETIRNAIIQKFNLNYKIDCENFADLKNYVLGKFKPKDILEYNSIVNQLKICDPAVGSGHFLVSALNEIISIKADLGILADKNGIRLTGYEVKIENDELIITYNDNTEIFEYTLSDNSINSETQRVQETIFHEKETIIENCLFGVDINPNSVKICRLRLWIELLKHAYYTEQSNFTELETLPNIDINIKCGNSLINRFAVKYDVFERVPNFQKKLNDYKFWVNEYKNTDEKHLRGQLWKNIQLFISEFKKRDPRVIELEKRLTKRNEEYIQKFRAEQLFVRNLTADQTKLKLKLETEIEKLNKELEGLKNNRIFSNAFEWRFEFPEVLDQEGNYIGFDIIIGNPPWGAAFDKATLSYIKAENSDVIVRMIDSFMFFINKSFSLKSAQGFVSMIVPDVLLYQLDNAKLRKKILDRIQLLEVINLGDNIFEDVARASTIFISGPYLNHKTVVGNYRKKQSQSLKNVSLKTIDTSLYKNLPYYLFPTDNIDGYKLLSEIDGVSLSELIDDDGIQRGVSPDYKDAFVVSDQIVEEYQLERANIKKTVTGGVDVKKYTIVEKSKKLIYTSSSDSPSEIPNIVKYIERFEDKITCKEVAEGKHPFFALHRAREEKIFTKKEKVIGVITSDKIITALDCDFFYPTDGLYLFAAKQGIDNRFLIAILNSKIATYLYRLFSFEEDRALAQVKPSILNDIPIPVVPAEDQLLFVSLVTFLEFLYDSKSKTLLSHTPNNRIAATIEEVLNMAVYELYFKKEMLDAKLDVIEFLRPLLQNAEASAERILDFYMWLQQPENPVRQRLLLSENRSREKITLINTSVN